VAPFQYIATHSVTGLARARGFEWPGPGRRLVSCGRICSASFCHPSQLPPGTVDGVHNRSAAFSRRPFFFSSSGVRFFRSPSTGVQPRTVCWPSRRTRSQRGSPANSIHHRRDHAHHPFVAMAASTAFPAVAPGCGTPRLRRQRWTPRRLCPAAKSPPSKRALRTIFVPQTFQSKCSPIHRTTIHAPQAILRFTNSLAALAILHSLHSHFRITTLARPTLSCTPADGQAHFLPFQNVLKQLASHRQFGRARRFR